MVDIEKALCRVIDKTPTFPSFPAFVASETFLALRSSPSLHLRLTSAGSDLHSSFRPHPIGSAPGLSFHLLLPYLGILCICKRAVPGHLGTQSCLGSLGYLTECGDLQGSEYGNTSIRTNYDDGNRLRRNKYLAFLAFLVTLRSFVTFSYYICFLLDRGLSIHCLVFLE